MEKFTKWADKGTHVNPFLPLRASSSSGLGSRTASSIFRTILFLIRLPVLLLASALLVVASIVTNPFTSTIVGAGLLGYSIQFRPSLQTTAAAIFTVGVGTLVIKPLHRLLTLLFVRTVAGLILRVLGVSFIEQHANVRKLGLRPPGAKQPSGRIGASIKGGDLLLSNHLSALDVLYFASRFLPIFTRFSIDTPEVDFGTLSLFAALWRESHVPGKTIPEGNDLASIIGQGRSEQRPVVVFPEVIRSNGEGVLAFAKGIFDKLSTGGSSSPPRGGPVRVHVFTFSSVKGGSPVASHTVGLAIAFIIRILSQWKTVINVTYVSSEDIPDFPIKASAGDGSSSSSSSKSVLASLVRKFPTAWMEEVRTLMSQMMGSPKLSVGYNDFVTFGNYYKAIARGDTTTAASLANARDKI